MLTRFGRIIILIILGLVMIGVLYLRGKYVFGGESLLFTSWMTWCIIARKYEKEGR